VTTFLIITTLILYFRSVFGGRKAHARKFRESIEKEIEPYGFKYISSRFPGTMKVGPFRHGILEIFYVLKNGGSIRDHIHYRIVQFSDSEGNNHRIWLKVIESHKRGLILSFSEDLANINSKSTED
jgi:hypothetical protein